MADYGHELEFGIFLTPSAGDAGAVLETVQRADDSGLDLVSFQDHPYQPRFLDTWTLISFLAAATGRVKLAPNVLSLPLRQPAVVARSVASLDILSGGRIELGIGAGAFWDAIEAMGGRRLTPGQGVDALAEAVEIIRGIWATDERGGVTFEGEHYTAEGRKARARPGPRRGDLDRGLQAEDAAADRPRGRRLAPKRPLPGTGAARERQRADRRSGGEGRP